MQVQWLSADLDCRRVILSGDVGGTNTTLALVGECGGKLEILLKCGFRSSEVEGILEPIERTLEEAGKRRPELEPAVCCICGAGPVENNYCTLTNVRWRIDGNEIENRLGIPTRIINDFSAISYSLPLLDVNDPAQIEPIPHGDGSVPLPSGSVRAVIGAGTGLGVGYLTETDGKPVAFPSEGGHTGFSPFDAETRALHEYVAERMSDPPGVEPFLSGQGLVNMFKFFRDTQRAPVTEVLEEIGRAPDEEKPRLIADHADDDAACRDMLRLFVRIYGRFASDVSVLLLPTQGMYLAGGIAMKNTELFLEDALFMDCFERNYKPNIRAVLETIPVYIIKDYSVSLYGAANAARWLLR